MANKKTVFVTLGATNHSQGEREKHDYYATDPKAIELLLDLETFDQNIWECACGSGHLSKVLLERGYNVRSTDLICRNYATELLDFLHDDNYKKWGGDIITNPPYKYAQEFVEKALLLINEGGKVAMFLAIQFLEGKKRREFFKKFPVQKVYVSSSRINCAKNGAFDQSKSSARCYAWFIWEKGFKGETILKWFN